jgi:putative endonuclease
MTLLCHAELVSASILPQLYFKKIPMPKIEHKYYVYILSNNKNGTLYIGMTNDIERRIYEHKNGLVEGFIKRYGLSKLVFCEFYKYVNDAIKREKQLKNWHRQWKINLIEENNPNWDDLSSDWFD